MPDIDINEIKIHKSDFSDSIPSSRQCQVTHKSHNDDDDSFELNSVSDLDEKNELINKSRVGDNNIQSKIINNDEKEDVLGMCFNGEINKNIRLFWCIIIND